MSKIIIGVTTPYQKDFELWKREVGVPKYGESVVFIKISTIYDLAGRDFMYIENGYKFQLVKEEVLLMVAHIIKPKYYYLKEGEIIKEGDEVEVSSKYNDEPKWIEAISVGSKAPNPNFIAHRNYRRRL